MPATKVATCCYCGTRAALVLAGRTQHELACASCGAPLHDLKQMPVRRSATPVRHGPVHGGHAGKEMPRLRKEKRMKRRKGLGARILSELWDALEDVID